MAVMMPGPWQTSALVFVGGGLGSCGRYWIGHGLAHWPSLRGLPWATLAINLSGSLALGILAAACHNRELPGHRITLLLLGTGFCGGYTTFSTFSVETIRLVHEGRWGWALANVVASTLGGIAAAAIGLRLVSAA